MGAASHFCQPRFWRRALTLHYLGLSVFLGPGGEKEQNLSWVPWVGEETHLDSGLSPTEPWTPDLVTYRPHRLTCPVLTHIRTLSLPVPCSSTHIHTNHSHIVTASHSTGTATLTGKLSLGHTQLHSHHPILLQSQPHLNRRQVWVLRSASPWQRL